MLGSDKLPHLRNKIPRKSLNYQTPYQVFLSYLKTLAKFDNLGYEKRLFRAFIKL